MTAPESGRLDVIISAHVATLSRAQAQRLIEDGRVRVNSIPATKSGAKIRIGDAIALDVPPPEPLEVVAEDIPLAILYEDAELIVIDKPAGLVVHPAPGHPRGTLVNALLFHCKDLSGIGGMLHPGIVHRLDKDTSGVMVATKSDRAHEALSAAFAEKTASGLEGVGQAKSGERPRSIERVYLAIASPPPAGTRGTLRTMHGRHPVDRKRFSSKVVAGKVMVTHWELVEKLGTSAALLRITLETGRTHQIRVHAADHGWPLVGDFVYGKRSELIARQALHAHRLAFTHPTTGERLVFEAPPPPDFNAALATLRGT